MAQLVAGMASSHAAALSGPDRWNQSRAFAVGRYTEKYGIEPKTNPRVAEETDDDLQRRYAPIREGFDFLRDKLAEKQLDALIVVGDDQHEQFTRENVPPYAIYLGEQIRIVDRHASLSGRSSDEEPIIQPCRADLAWELLVGCTEAGIELSACHSFPNDLLIAHAMGPPVRRLVPNADIPVVFLFINAVEVPAPSPRRCYELGQVIRQVVSGWSGGSRVAIYGSGGLSHFTISFPYKFLQGRYGYGFGSIAEEFDREQLAAIAAGEGHKVTQLTSQDLLENGEHEFRAWTTVLGAIGATKPELLLYEPFYRVNMGMGLAYWELEREAALV